MGFKYQWTEMQLYDNTPVNILSKDEKSHVLDIDERKKLNDPYQGYMPSRITYTESNLIYFRLRDYYASERPHQTDKTENVEAI